MIVGIALILAGIAAALLGLIGAPAGARHPGAITAGVLGVIVTILGVLVVAGVSV